MAKILIADDDEIFIEIARYHLEADGHNVVNASDGEQALVSVSADRPDLIILDSMMPVLSGPEVLNVLQADPVTASIPVVMLTARKSDSDVVSAIRSGAAEYMTKPFIPSELIVRVEMLLKRAA